jgi:hypothetical protein
LLDALHTKDKEAALMAVQDAVSQNVDMKLFTRVLLEHIRAVMLLRNMPTKKASLLSAFGSDTQAKLEGYVAGESPLNSHMLLRFLQAFELVNRSPIPHAPIEIAIIELTEK